MKSHRDISCMKSQKIIMQLKSMKSQKIIMQLKSMKSHKENLQRHNKYEITQESLIKKILCSEHAWNLKRKSHWCPKAWKLIRNSHEISKGPQTTYVVTMNHGSTLNLHMLHHNLSTIITSHHQHQPQTPTEPFNHNSVSSRHVKSFYTIRTDLQ